MQNSFEIEHLVLIEKSLIKNVCSYEQNIYLGAIICLMGRMLLGRLGFNPWSSHTKDSKNGT